MNDNLNNNNNNNFGANHPYSQLWAELRRTRLQRVREAGMQGRLWLPATSTHYDHGAQPKIESIWFFTREENRMVWKTFVAQQRTNAQLNSHMALARNQTRVTLVRGERFTHTPTVPPKVCFTCWALVATARSSVKQSILWVPSKNDTQ